MAEEGWVLRIQEDCSDDRAELLQGPCQGASERTVLAGRACRTLLITASLVTAGVAACSSAAPWSRELRDTLTHSRRISHQGDVLPTVILAATPSSKCSGANENCNSTLCCRQEGHLCYEKNSFWSGCNRTCDPHSADWDGKHWSCKELGSRASTVTQAAKKTRKPSKAASGGSSGASVSQDAKKKKQKTRWWQFWKRGVSTTFTTTTMPATASMTKETRKTTATTTATATTTMVPTTVTRTSTMSATATTSTFPAATDGTVCAWAGHDCSASKCCNEPGMHCYKKDKYWASCQQNCTPGSGDWQCDKLGGSVAERPPLRPAEGSAVTMGTSLFCFVVVTPGTYEVDLVHFLQASRLTAFACDASGVFTGQKAQFISKGLWQSVINTDVFIDIWNKVRLDGQYKDHDWTVKSDPDSVFLPDRLRTHIRHLGVPQGARLYIKNQPASTSTWDFGFVGPIEVFTREAIDLYLESQGSCSRHQGHKSGEDYYMKTCMEALGVNYMRDEAMLRLNNDPSGCKDSWVVAFHAFKNQAKWMQCYNIAVSAPPN